MMANLTLVHLDEGTPTPLDASTIQSVKNSYQAWAQLDTAVGTGAPENAKQLLQKMHTAISTAEQALEAYGKKPTSDYLWQAQAQLMQSILAEKQLLAAIAK
jgi:hypothetical protein